MRFRWNPDALLLWLLASPMRFQAAFLGVLAPFMLVLTARGASLAASRGGHLPWPALQWVFTIPAGAVLVAITIAGLTSIPILFVLWRDFQRKLRRARDLTEVPDEEWPTASAMPREPMTRDYWLGRGHHTQSTSQVISVVTGVFVLLLLGGCVAAFAYALPFPQCGAYGCPPSYPAGDMGIAAAFLGLWLTFLAPIVWQWRVEARCGIVLQYRSPVNIGLFDYVRRPGVTAEAATTALSRFISANASNEAPAARFLAAFVFAYAPLFVAILLSIPLATWLPYQWIPR